MRIGISVCSAFPEGDPKTSARHMIERVRAARGADLDSLFVGDHHVTSRPYFQNSPILGRLLAEWNNKPAGALYLLPLWNPVLLAEQIGTLASIMQGRFILQCSLGGEKKQSEGMGVDFSKRVGMFEESLRLIKALLAGERVSSEDYWAISDAKISPVPDTKVEFWIGSQANVAINRAARLADGWLATPSIGIDEAAKQLNVDKQSCAEHNRQPTAISIRRDIYIGSTSQEAEVLKQNYIDKGYRGFAPEALLAGSVNQVAEEFAKFEALGYTDIVVRNISSEQSEAVATIERLSEVKSQLGG